MGTGGRFVAFRRDCNHLLVLQVLNPQEAAIVYDGPAAPAWEAAGMHKSNGQQTISLSKLRELTVNQALTLSAQPPS